MAEPHIDEQGRPEPPFAADEVETLKGYLDYQRSTLEWKTRGLTTEQLRTRAIPTSVMTLGGILGHLAWVESYWFEEVTAGQKPPAPWDTMDFAADEDADWALGNSIDADEVRSLWMANVERSRCVVDEAVAKPDGLGTVVEAWGGRAQVSVRWVITHMIEEYARHNGHADILREAIDGETGE